MTLPARVHLETTKCNKVCIKSNFFVSNRNCGRTFPRMPRNGLGLPRPEGPSYFMREGKRKERQKEGKTDEMAISIHTNGYNQFGTAFV